MTCWLIRSAQWVKRERNVLTQMSALIFFMLDVVLCLQLALGLICTDPFAGKWGNRLLRMNSSYRCASSASYTSQDIDLISATVQHSPRHPGNPPKSLNWLHAISAQYQCIFFWSCWLKLREYVQHSRQVSSGGCRGGGHWGQLPPPLCEAYFRFLLYPFP